MIKFNEVTWYSKLAAIIFFIGVLPALTFYIGTQYQLYKSSMESSNIEGDNNSGISISQTSSDPADFYDNSSSNDFEEFEKKFKSDFTSYKWVWEETLNGTGPNALDAGKIVPKKPEAFTLTFNKNGQVSGTTDCNSFSGTYKYERGVLKIGPLASTLMFCENSQESEFLSAFKTGNIGQVEDSFTLENDKTMIFVKGDKI